MGKKIIKKTVTTTITEEINDNLSTEIIAILDRSGSMGSIIDDCIGGFNMFVKKQQELKDKTLINVYTFDDFYEEIVTTMPIDKFEPLTSNEWSPRGMTALYDTIGKIVYTKEQLYKKEGNSPDRTLVIITTDGQDNQSHEFNTESIKKLIERKRKDGWEFIFTAANQDAFSGGQSLGITGNNTYTWTTNTSGIKAFYTSLSDSTINYRTSNVATTVDFFNSGDGENNEK